MKLLVFERQISFTRKQSRPIQLQKPVYVLTTLDPQKQLEVALEYFPMYTCDVERSHMAGRTRTLIGFEKEEHVVEFANMVFEDLRKKEIPLIATSVLDEERIHTASTLLRLPLMIVSDLDSDNEKAEGIFEGLEYI